jgi:hypothetical protein
MSNKDFNTTRDDLIKSIEKCVGENRRESICGKFAEIEQSMSYDEFRKVLVECMDVASQYPSLMPPLLRFAAAVSGNLPY